MKIAIGSDHAGFELKKQVVQFLKLKHEIKDFGTYSLDSCDFPDYAKKVCESVSTGKYDRGILICLTGTGTAIASNKFRNIIATNIYSLTKESLDVIKHDREHLNSNVLCLGAKFLDIEFVKKVIDIWLTTDFKGNESDGERFTRRLNKIKEIEGEQMKISKEAIERIKKINELSFKLNGGKEETMTYTLESIRGLQTR